MLDSIKAERQEMRLGTAIGTGLLWLLSLPFFMAGWVLGAIWRAILWIAAAFVAGFKAGRGDDGTT